MHHGISGRFLMQIFPLHVTMLKNQGRGTSFDAQMINSSEPRLGLSPDSPDPGKLLWWSGTFSDFFRQRNLWIIWAGKKIWRKNERRFLWIFLHPISTNITCFLCSNDGLSGYFFWQSGWQQKGGNHIFESKIQGFLPMDVFSWSMFKYQIWLYDQ